MMNSAMGAESRVDGLFASFLACSASLERRESLIVLLHGAIAEASGRSENDTSNEVKI